MVQSVRVAGFDRVAARPQADSAADADGAGRARRRGADTVPRSPMGCSAGTGAARAGRRQLGQAPVPRYGPPRELPTGGAGPSFEQVHRLRTGVAGGPRAERLDRTQRLDHPERGDRLARLDRPERPARPAVPNRPWHADRPEASSVSGGGPRDLRDITPDQIWGAAPKYVGKERDMACGPVAAAAMLRATGRDINLTQAMDRAVRSGLFTIERGMEGGLAGELALMESFGLDIENAPGEVDWDRVAEEVEAGRPVTIVAPGYAPDYFGHYYVVEDYDADTGKFHLGNTAEVLDVFAAEGAQGGYFQNKGDARDVRARTPEWMSPGQIERFHDEGVMGAIYLKS